jgi:hypothetical protein
MTENVSTQHRISISCKALQLNSAVEMKEGGRFPTSITFHLVPPASLGRPCDLQLNLFGEDLNRAVRFQQKSDPSVVEIGLDWWVRHCKTWREDIIDLALQPFAFAKGAGGISG